MCKSICGTTEGDKLLGLTDVAHAVIRHHVRLGDCVVDATVGNGRDTQYLADQVGPGGRVYGFDVQAAALEVARQLPGVNLPNVTLFPVGHERMKDYVPAEHHGRVVHQLQRFCGSRKFYFGLSAKAADLISRIELENIPSTLT